MATVTIERLPGEPVLLVAVSGRREEVSTAERDPSRVRVLLDEADEPLFLVLDMSDAEIGLDGMMGGARDAYLGAQPLFRHPNIRAILHVSDDATLEMATSGLDSEVFGNIKIQQFKTREDALAYARAAR